MVKSVYPNRKNKYNNKLVYALIDKDGEIYPFPTKAMASLFIKQNPKLDFKMQKFDSTLEFERFQFLKGLEKSGKIEDLQTQVDFELIPSQEYNKEDIMPNGVVVYKKRKMRGTKYIADFTYKINDILVVEDTKSAITRKKPEYRIKKKLMLLMHKIVVKEVDKKWVNTL